MTSEEMLNKIQEITTALGDAVAAEVQKVGARCDALDAELKQLKADAAKKKDDDGEDDTLAEGTAADSVSRAEYRVLQDQVRDLQIKQPARRMANLDQYADVQAKCDSAFIALGSRAEPPMVNESLVDYSVRLHRMLQKHSPKWKNAELAAIARDSTTFNVACDAIRSDATQAGLNPIDLKPFEHRMIRETMPSGHVMTRFVGNGTVFKQLSRPVRHVAYIGTRA
jgi:hypothetical protein